jgi:hypothetical protein
MTMTFTPSSGQESTALRKIDGNEPGPKHSEHSDQKHRNSEVVLRGFSTLAEEEKSMDSFSDYKLQRNMSIKECPSELEEDPKG